MSYRPYPTYRPSATEWLGNVPAHWEVLSIKRLTPVSRGSSPRPIEDPKYFDEEGEYAWVRIADVSSNDHYLRETTQRLSDLGKSLSVPLEPGSLFLSIAGSVGKPMITAIKACIHDGFVYFPYLQIDPEYLYYIFESGQPYLGLGKLGTQLNLNTDTVGNIKIGLPPREEQDAIVLFLDWKISQIDALIAKKQALIEKLKEKRLAVITQAVTKGLDASVPLRDSHIPWLGQIPKHWDVPSLKMRYTVELGKMLDEKKIVGDRLIPYLRNTDVQWDRINFDELPEMDISEEEYQRYTVRENDVLVCEGGEVGRAAIVGKCDEVLGYQKALHRLRAMKSNEIPRFIYYTLLWAANTGVFLVEGASTIAHLTADQLRRYHFPQPPENEQRDIVDFLDQAVGRLEKMLEKTNTAIVRLTEYRTALITAATTGQIDVRKVAIPAQA